MAKSQPNNSGGPLSQARITAALAKAKKAAENKKKEKKIRKTAEKYVFLHIPSGQYLKFSTACYVRENTKSVFGYVKKHDLIHKFLTLSNPERAEIIQDSAQPSTEIRDLEGCKVLCEFKNPAIARIDRLDAYGGLMNCFTSRDYLEEFTSSGASQSLTCDICTVYETKPHLVTSESECGILESELEYSITLQDLTSWDSIYSELFKYLQDNHFFIILTQFSASTTKREKIYLSEFEIVRDVKNVAGT